VIYIVSDFHGTYHLVVARLTRDAGAKLIELDPGRRLDRTISKLGILRQMTTPRLMRLRRQWTREDAVLVMSWYLIPVLLLMRVGLLPRPRRLVSLGAFVHDTRVRRLVNVLLRAFKVAELEFIVFSHAERRNLIDSVGLSAERVHRVVYRGKLLGPVAAADADADADGEYVFTGGYSNRDYATFFAAVRPLHDAVIAAASALNDLDDPPPNVDLRLDVSWDDFEELVRRCALLVLPLREGGEACGQGVLVRGIHHHRPVIATRHDSLIDYLGDDYPGFVPPRDPDALRLAIERGLYDDGFRRCLFERVAATARSFREQEFVEAEIAGIVTR
jgi:glycosyltransferase involved in cell wall biosynthesis